MQADDAIVVEDHGRAAAEILRDEIDADESRGCAGDMPGTSEFQANR